MPIHDQGYQRYQGQRVPVGRAWWTMARMHLITAFKRRWFLLLVFAGWASLLYRIHAEEHVLCRDDRWTPYVASVPYRMFPGLW